jgi:hypothetical protein
VVLTFIKKRLFARVAPGLYGQKRELDAQLAHALTEIDALREALVLKHQQANGAVGTLLEVIAALAMAHGGETVTVSADMLASANCLPPVRLDEQDDGSIVVSFPKDDQCVACECEVGQ